MKYWVKRFFNNGLKYILLIKIKICVELNTNQFCDKNETINKM